MAKVHLDRLRRQYKGVEITGSLYSDIVEQIIDQNTENVQKKMFRMSNKRMQKVSDKISTKTKRLVVPDMSDVLPKRALHIRKVAESKDFVSETLRSNLTKTLRDTIGEFMEDTGETAMVPKRGSTTGRIHPDLINQFEKNITNVFQGYTKKHPRFNMPSNVHDIAVTEIRSSINEIKNSYTQRLLEKNEEDFEVTKTWIQNKSKSKVPRKGHSLVNGKTIGFREIFMVPHYEKEDGKVVQMFVTPMKHPHDPNAPGSQVIGCNCDFDIKIRRRPKRKKT